MNAPMDPVAQLRGSLVSGIFTGRVLQYDRDGEVAVLQGLTGPHRVVIPSVLFKKRRPNVGEEVSYVGMFKPGVRDVAIGARVIYTRSMP